jgi:hypothetical protein
MSINPFAIKIKKLITEGGLGYTVYGASTQGMPVSQAQWPTDNQEIENNVVSQMVKQHQLTNQEQMLQPPIVELHHNQTVTQKLPVYSSLLAIFSKVKVLSTISSIHKIF